MIGIIEKFVGMISPGKAWLWLVVLAAAMGAVAAWYKIEALAADNARLVASYESALATNSAMQVAFNNAREAQKQADALEVQYHDQSREINTLAADNRRLADELGGLRDPYAAAPSGGDSGDTPGCTVCEPCDGKLSKEASLFLLEFAEEADRLRAYADTCYKWVTWERPGVMGEPD
jgi:hypothetical protein